jgi:hypothetical protein
MPIWDAIQAATDQQCLDYIAANQASAQSSNESNFRNDHSWAELRELNGHLVGLIVDPLWPNTTKPAGFFNTANAMAFTDNV